MPTVRCGCARSMRWAAGTCGRGRGCDAAGRAARRSSSGSPAGRCGRHDAHPGRRVHAPDARPGAWPARHRGAYPCSICRISGGPAARLMIDMDDLVAARCRCCVATPRRSTCWRARGAVLLVDESQDLDRTQLELALLLAGERRDIFLVGDDDQTIYAWRLADVRRILGPGRRALPGLQRVDLTTNYRCPPEVVRRAARLVEHVTERFVKRIDAAPPGDGRRWSWRPTRATTWPVPVGCSRRGMAAMPAGTRSWRGPTPARAVRGGGHRAGIPFRVEQDGLRLDDPAIDALLARVAGTGATAIAARCGIGGGRGRRARRAVCSGWAAACATLAIAAGGDRRAHGRPDGAARRARHLVLATAHGTKGLEFDHVAVVGMDEGVFPSDRSIEDARPGARPGRGAAPRVRGVDARAPGAGARLRPGRARPCSCARHSRTASCGRRRVSAGRAREGRPKSTWARRLVMVSPQPSSASAYASSPAGQGHRSGPSVRVSERAVACSAS